MEEPKVVDYRNGNVYVNARLLEPDHPAEVMWRGHPVKVVKNTDGSIDMYRTWSYRLNSSQIATMIVGVLLGIVAFVYWHKGKR